MKAFTQINTKFQVYFFAINLIIIWEFGYIHFSLSISMLRMNHTNDDLEEFFGEMDEEFETLESVIKSALEIVEVYEKQIELSNLKFQN